MTQKSSLWLSYIAESPLHECFDPDFATDADGNIGVLKTKAENREHDIKSIPSSFLRDLPLQCTVTQSVVYRVDEEQTSKKFILSMTPPSERRLRKNHSFEIGEPSRFSSISHRVTESFEVESSSSQATTLVGTENGSRFLRNELLPLKGQISIYKDIAQNNEMEMNVLYTEREVGHSVTDVDSGQEITEISNDDLAKGKAPLRPNFVYESMLQETIEQKGNLEKAKCKGRDHTRSALKRSLDSQKMEHNRHEIAGATSTVHTDYHEAKTIVQFKTVGDERDTMRYAPSLDQGITAEETESFMSDDDESDASQEYKVNNDYNFEDKESNEMIEPILHTKPGSAVSVNPYRIPLTGREVFLFECGIVIPRRDTETLIYGVAIPGKIFRRQKSRYPSTSALLMGLAKANLDELGIWTADSETILTQILYAAEEAYREAKHGRSAWLSLIRERKQRYDLETRPWGSMLYPWKWRRHGLILPEGHDPPEQSCKFKMVTMCGKVLHLWYVRCDSERVFGPRDIVVKISCGEGDKCDASSNWVPEDGYLKHDDSAKQWIEVDPDKGAGLSEDFHPFMKFWIIEGPPKETPPPGCMKINCVTKCGFVKSRIRLLCEEHTSKSPKCIGGEFTMLIDRGCSLRDDIHRCDEKEVCEGYIDWIGATLGLSVDSLTPKQLDGLGKLHSTLKYAYKKDTKGMGSFFKHQKSEKRWKEVIYNHVDFYNMLFDWGLRTIQYPADLSIVRVNETVVL